MNPARDRRLTDDELEAERQALGLRAPGPAPCLCGCGVVIERPRVRLGRVQRFASLPCYGRWREVHDPAWAEARRRGAVNTGRRNRAKAAAAIRPKVAGLSAVEAYRLGHHEGYCRGWKRGIRVGTARGWDAALEEGGNRGESI